MSDPFASLKYMSLPIASAAIASDLTPDELESAADSMFVLRKHRQLSNAPVFEARRDFERLDKNLQDQIKNTFGDAEYISRENSSWFSNAKYAVKDVFSGGMDVLEGFSNLISLAPRKIISGKSWSEAWDGNKLFDEERLDKVKRFYSPEVFDIAYKLSTKSTIGEIVANAKTDAELEAVMRLLSGDQTMMEALRDVDTSKISLGRETFYTLFDIDPGEFGANRKAFNFFSGAVDLASQVGLDPLTYVAPWAKAIQGTRRGILKFALEDAAQFGVPATAASGRGLIKALPGTKNKTLGEMLSSGRVRMAFDEIGENIKLISESTDIGVRADARMLILSKYPEIAPDAIPQLSKALKEIGDFTHQGFIKYVDNWEKLNQIALGKPGQSERLLPSYSNVRRVGGVLSSLSRGAITNAEANKTFDSAVDAISNGVGVDRKIKIAMDQRILRSTEKALLDNSIAVRGDAALRDSRKLYALARNANLDRYSSGVLVEKWNIATEGERIQIIEGLSKTIGKNLGLDLFDDGQKLMDNVGRVLIGGEEAYTAGIKVTEENFKALSKFIDSDTLSEYLKSGDLLKAGEVDGIGKAIYVYQLAGEVSIPSMGKWLQVASGRGAQRNLLMRGAGGSVNGKLVETLTNAWSWAVLVPRLGIRSAIDEIAMYGLTHPATGLKDFVVGRSLSKIVRTGKAATRFGLTGKKATGLGRFSSDQGLAYGIIYRNLEKFLDPSDIQMLAKTKSPDVTEKIFQRALMKAKMNTVNGTKLLGKGTDEAVDAYLDVLPSKMGLIDDLNTGVGRANYMQDGMAPRSTETAVEILSVTKADKPLRVQKVSGGYESVELANVNNLDVGKFTDGWQVSLGKVFNSSTDGKVADIVVQNLDNEELALKLLTEFWEKNPKLLEEFANVAGKPISAREKAIDSYVGIVSLISRSGDGTVNRELLDAMRGVDGTYRASRLTPEVFAKMSKEDLPASLAMPQFTLVPRNNAELIAQTVVDGTYSWMERQVATLAREPIMNANFIKYWKQLEPNRQNMVRNLMKNGLSKEAATKQANTAAANLAMTEAFQRTIAYVDNPAVRTHLAFTVRNYARFFRSLEDFSRRVYRMAKYEPLAFRNLRLTNEGLEHSGFIYEDSEGDKYFMFPGDAIVNNVLNPIVSVITGEEIKTPMPLQFTGKIKMLAPSFDPEAAIPTLSGPMAALSTKVIEKIFRLGTTYTGNESIANLGDDLSGLVLGRYAEGKTLSQLLIPPSVQRALALFSSDDKDSQWASATRKAMMYYAANGMAPGADATPGEIEEFKDMVAATARNIVVTRFAMGLLSPVSPTLDSGVDMPDYLREFGVVNFKQAFYDMVNEYGDDPQGYEKALRKWSRVKPGALAYTISETDANTVASVKKTQEAARYYRDNAGLFKRYPEGAAFFLPFDGEYSLESYTFLKREGFTEAKPVEDFLKEVVVANEKQTYDQQKKYYEDLAAVAGSNEATSMVNARAAEWRQQYLSDKPLLKELITTFSGSEGRRQGVIKELSQMVSDPRVPDTDLKRKYSEMLNAFYRGMNALENYPGQTERQVAYRKILRNSLAAELESIARGNPEAEMALKMLFRPSIFIS
jgi:hypothetical protein